MERYYVYNIKFSVSINKTQQDALEALSKYLPDQIIVNTSSEICKDFADGKDIGSELEIESKENFDPDALVTAVVMVNKDLGSNVIEAVHLVAENQVKEYDVLTDLVELSEE